MTKNATPPPPCVRRQCAGQQEEERCGTEGGRDGGDRAGKSVHAIRDGEKVEKANGTHDEQRRLERREREREHPDIGGPVRRIEVAVRNRTVEKKIGVDE
jgi:hypothetical protein